MQTDQPRQPRRKRNAAATRGAILTAARTCFSRESYERVGVREIAALAGVDPALVIRYFGRKENLYSEAVAQGFAVGPLLEGPRDQLGQRLARAVFQKDRAAGDMDALLALLRSVGHEQVGATLRAALAQQFTQPLAQWLGGPDADLRAGLIAASMLGLVTSYYVIGLDTLTGGPPERLVALLAPLLQRYVDGPVDTLGSSG